MEKWVTFPCGERHGWEIPLGAGTGAALAATNICPTHGADCKYEPSTEGE